MNGLGFVLPDPAEEGLQDDDSRHEYARLTPRRQGEE
jgi:hypothetical protein